jgi:PTH1 family peptidyl-tRNA hydrolase
MFVIAGLGNPEPRYARNRHNIGFHVVEAFADVVGAEPWRSKFHGDVSRCRAANQDVLLVRPMTYMNDSGRAIQAALSFFRVPLTDLLVVHDELDLPFGTLRLKQGGGHAGHNGLKSIIEYVGSADFPRLRMGIGKPPPGFTGQMADYVLSDFNAEQRAELPDVVEKAVKSLRLVLRRGLPEAMKALNTRPKPPKPSKSPSSEAPSGRDLSAPPADPIDQNATSGPALPQEGVASPAEKR